MRKRIDAALDNFRWWLHSQADRVYDVALLAKTKRRGLFLCRVAFGLDMLATYLPIKPPEQFKK